MHDTYSSKTIYIILFCITLFPSLLAADDPNDWENYLDAILRNNHITDSTKIEEISDLASEYFYIAEEDILHRFLASTLPIADRLGKNEYKIKIYSTASSLAVDAEDQLNMLDSCIYYLEKSEDPKTRSIGWLHLGRMLSDDISSLDYFIKALDEIEGKDLWDQEVEVYRGIASYYSLQGNYKNHIKYAELALESARKTKDAPTIIGALNDLGVAYYEIPSDDFYDQAIDILTEGIDLYKEQLTDERFEDEYAQYMFLCINLAKVFYQKEEFETSSTYLNEALLIALEYEIPEYQIECYLVLADIANKREDAAAEEKNLLKALALLPDMSLHYLETRHLAYSVNLKLAEFYAKTEDYKKATTYYIAGLDEYKHIYDAQMATESQKLITSYEIKKKEAEIQDTESLLEVEQKQKYLYIAIVIALIIALGLLFYMFSYKMQIAKQNRKLLSDEANIIALEKNKIKLDNLLKQQEAEHLEKQLSIGSDLIDTKNKTFENLKKFLADHPELDEYKGRIETILMRQNRIENNVEEFKSGLQDIPVDFYIKLQKKADNKLTPLDLKYCRLIYLNTSSSEMADLLFVDPKSIRVGKYRLKQKLGLSKDEKLGAFIKNIINESTEHPN